MVKLIREGGHDAFVTDLLRQVWDGNTFGTSVGVTFQAGNRTQRVSSLPHLFLGCSHVFQRVLSSFPAEEASLSIHLPDFSLEAVEVLLCLLHTGTSSGLDIKQTLCNEVEQLAKVLGLQLTAEKIIDGGRQDQDQEVDAISEESSPRLLIGELSPTSTLSPLSQKDENHDHKANAESPSQETALNNVENNEDKLMSEVDNSDGDSSQEVDWEKKDDTTKLTVKLEENLSKAKERSDDLKNEHDQKKEKVKVKKKRILMRDLDPEELICKQCGKEFPALYKLKIHALIHSKSPPFVCSLCGKGFNNKYKLNVHEKNHPLTKEEKSLKTPKVEKVKLKKTLMCEKCHCVFTTKGALQTHFSQVHPNVKRFHCQTCGNAFKGQKGLRRHQRFVCNRVEKSFPCPTCQTKFATPQDVKNHIAAKHQSVKEEWKCDQCPTVCNSKRNLKAHKRAIHLEDGVAALPFQCSHCGKAFLKQAYLDDHHNRHHSTVKAFVCMYCPKECSTKQDLDRHLTTHTGKSVFQCTFCTKTYAHRSNFKQHMRTHLGEKLYKCMPCSKNFGLLSALKKHHLFHEKKGDTTKIVKAPKGRRGCISYLDFDSTKNVIAEKSGKINNPSTAHPRPIAYIPSGHYIASRGTSLTQMQVLGDYGDYGRVHPSGQQSNLQTQIIPTLSTQKQPVTTAQNISIQQSNTDHQQIVHISTGGMMTGNNFSNTSGLSQENQCITYVEIGSNSSQNRPVPVTSTLTTNQNFQGQSQSSDQLLNNEPYNGDFEILYK